MSIETKEVRNSVSIYEKFGWKVKEEKRVGHAKHHHTVYVLVRDDDMPHYDELVSLENKYFSLKSKIQTYDPVAPVYVIITFIFFIFPLFIYLYIKHSQKKEIEEKNNQINKQMQDILLEAEKLL